MSTHNICFHGEIRKILCGYLLLSGAMVYSKNWGQASSNNIDPDQMLQIWVYTVFNSPSSF